MGDIVENARRPLIWVPGQLPFHVTDPSRLQIICPMRHRIYASYVDRNVPYFETALRLGESTPGYACVDGNSYPAYPNVLDEPSGRDDIDPHGLEALLTIPDALRAGPTKT